MNTKLRCILLDDELPGLTYLKMLCEQIPALELVKTFNQSAALLQELPRLEFDLCILDIEMPGMNGLQLANVLNGKGIIFTTAYKEFAAEAFDLNAIDYVRKPFTRERLQQAIDKALQRLSPQVEARTRPYMRVNTDQGKTLLFFDQLLYLTTSAVDSRDKEVWLLDGQRMVIKNMSFAQLLAVLPPQLFSQVNKQEIIAISSIQFITQDEVVTKLREDNGKPKTLLVGDAYKKAWLGKSSSGE